MATCRGRRVDTFVVFDVAKRLLVGQPLRSSRLGETLLPKRASIIHRFARWVRATL